MELTTFNAQNSHQKSGDPIIRFSPKGVISINKHGVKKVGLSPGDEIIIHQDKRRTKDWYLEKVSAGGFILRGISGGDSLLFNCATLSNAVLKSLDKQTAVKIPIAPQMTEGKYYALLTSTIQ